MARGQAANKAALATWLADTHGLHADPRSIFDCQCKRIHEYKRQHLNLLHVITLWDRLRRGEDIGRGAHVRVRGQGRARVPRGEADHPARARRGRRDRAPTATARDRLRVVFVPDFNVKIAQRIYPAADVSEQISTAGLEASGTGNMKFTLNGALTIGTLDGANVEIREAVGASEFFLFGLTARAGDRRASARLPPRERDRATTPSSRARST